VVLSFVLGIALLVFLGAFLHAFAASDPRSIIRIGKWLAGALAVLAGVLLAATGRLQVLIGLGALLLPLLPALIRARRMNRLHARMAGAAADQTSTLETRFFRMALDHETGDLDGEILEGPFIGRRLGSLGVEQLRQLLTVCRREDAASSQVLEAFLDRYHPAWRTAGPEEEAASEGGETTHDRRGMTRDEAYRILGLQPSANEAQVRAAHHRLIAGVHPDRGGSTELAALVNQARDVLLGRVSSS
jgi:hypothetical protein